jgi:hypothetical protein
MSERSKNAVVRLQAFINAYLEGMQQLPEDELLKGQNVAEEQARFERIMQNAKRTAGQRRLAVARSALDRRTSATSVVEPIDLAEARRVIGQAANDARITLAARQLDDMPDEEVERLYRQLIELGIANPKKTQ